MGFMDFFSGKDTQDVNVGPWGPQQGYILDVFRQAQDLQKQGGPQYFPGPTLSERNPLITQGEEGKLAYAGGDEFRNMMDKSYTGTTDRLGGGYFGYNDIFNDPNVGSAYKQALSGDPNPYTADAARAVRQDMMEDYSGIGGAAQQIRNAAIGSGQHGGGTRQQLMDRRGQDELNENMTNATAQMYNQNYNSAQDRMLAGMGIAENARQNIGREGLANYGTAMSYVPQQYNMEMGAQNVPIGVGTSRQAYDQATIDDARKRWEYEQQLPYANLDWYQGKVGGNYGQTGTTTTTSSPSPWSVGKELFNTGVGIASTIGGLAGGGMGGMGGMSGMGGGFGGVPFTDGLSLQSGGPFAGSGSYFGS